ncbi:uncharacterized protein TNCT_323431 [Trichonephila clavata]|uniref:Uncharacterized protein n=1 Tax=Trichonephila clavata TaxID=2740835 RepID=A0A8X6LM57_TRICU|nr:uncharacterized protein TNCT_323431 [Trichonephila clavata]
MQHQLFGGRETLNQSHDVYELLLCSLDESYSLCVELFSEKKLCGKAPKVSNPVVINELNRRGIILSDLAYEDCEIDLLLGANVVGLLFMGGSIELELGLFLLRTCLGFVLTGKQEIFDRFSSYPIGLSADIEKAFLQLGIAPKHLDFLRFFHPDEGEEIVYRHCRVVIWCIVKSLLVSCSTYDKRLAPQNLVSFLVICANFRASPPSDNLRIFVRMTSLPRGIMLESVHFAVNPIPVNLLLLKA